MEAFMAYQSVNPTTGEILKTFANHTDAEIQSALTVAHALYKSDWSKGPIQPRLDVLKRFAHLIQDRSEELARVLVNEMGKRIWEARGEVSITAGIAARAGSNITRSA
jgi:succinate-semialdehyde dehydrogenase/glutarate-semialdehyde dehydrogenase